eukprot:gene10728-11911_t
MHEEEDLLHEEEDILHPTSNRLQLSDIPIPEVISFGPRIVNRNEAARLNPAIRTLFGHVPRFGVNLMAHVMPDELAIHPAHVLYKSHHYPALFHFPNPTAIAKALFHLYLLVLRTFKNRDFKPLIELCLPGLSRHVVFQASPYASAWPPGTYPWINYGLIRLPFIHQLQDAFEQKLPKARIVEKMVAVVVASRFQSNNVWHDEMHRVLTAQFEHINTLPLFLTRITDPNQPHGSLAQYRKNIEKRIPTAFNDLGKIAQVATEEFGFVYCLSNVQPLRAFVCEKVYDENPSRNWIVDDALWQLNVAYKETWGSQTFAVYFPTLQHETSWWWSRFNSSAPRPRDGPVLVPTQQVANSDEKEIWPMNVVKFSHTKVALRAPRGAHRLPTSGLRSALAWDNPLQRTGDEPAMVFLNYRNSNLAEDALQRLDQLPLQTVSIPRDPLTAGDARDPVIVELAAAGHCIGVSLCRAIDPCGSAVAAIEQ